MERPDPGCNACCPTRPLNSCTFDTVSPPFERTREERASCQLSLHRWSRRISVYLSTDFLDERSEVQRGQWKKLAVLIPVRKSNKKSTVLLAKKSSYFNE